MNVLIAEDDVGLSQVWTGHLRRQDIQVSQAYTHHEVLQQLRSGSFDAMIMNLKFPDASVLAISDLATYRNPGIAIILVTADRFFSDGSIFDLVPNARGFVNDQVKPDDLAAMVQHFAA